MRCLWLSDWKLLQPVFEETFTQKQCMLLFPHCLPQSHQKQTIQELPIHGHQEQILRRLKKTEQDIDQRSHHNFRKSWNNYKVRQRTLTDDIGLLEEAAHQTWKHEWTRKYPNQHWWTPQRYPFASETLQPPEGKRRSTKTTKTTKTTTHKHTHTWGNRLSKSRKACNAEATAAIRERSNFSNSAKTAGTSVS